MAVGDGGGGSVNTTQTITFMTQAFHTSCAMAQWTLHGKAPASLNTGILLLPHGAPTPASSPHFWPFPASGLCTCSCHLTLTQTLWLILIFQLEGYLCGTASPGRATLPEIAPAPHTLPLCRHHCLSPSVL